MFLVACVFVSNVCNLLLIFKRHSHTRTFVLGLSFLFCTLDISNFITAFPKWRGYYVAVYFTTDVYSNLAANSINLSHFFTLNGGKLSILLFKARFLLISGF